MKSPPLVFIDTNILLDFYRVRGKEASLGLLRHIDNNHESIITTNQVEMEFKKNRQRVILDALGSFKVPNWSSLQVPAFLQEAQPAQMISKARDQIKAQSTKIETRIARVLRSPAKHDPVYQTLQRLFRAEGRYNLTRENPVRHTVRRRALRRFLLGYPPRKPTDTSYGDAINWEWIIECASSSKRGVVIVSRDSDYGAAHGKELVVNDWLGHEFHERVGKTRQVTLTDRLAEGFKRASIKVSKEDARGEEQLIAEQQSAQQATQRVLQLRNLFLHDSAAVSLEDLITSLRKASAQSAGGTKPE